MGQHRRQFLIATGALVATGLARAQQPRRLRRIGLLGINHRDHPAAQQLRTGIMAALARLGYREGEHLVLELRFAEGKLDRLPALAAGLVQSNVELILSPTNATTHVLQKTTQAIPIVMVTSAHPVENGFVASYARPGGNITGLDIWPTIELSAKFFQILKLAAPRAKIAGVIFSANDTTEQLYGDDFYKRIESNTGLSIVRFPMLPGKDVAQILNKILASRADVLFVAGGESTTPHIGAIAAFAAKHGLSSIGSGPVYLDVGGLLYYGIELNALWERTASYVDRIMRGAKPGELPVERPAKYELVLNAKTARAMGLALSPSFMAQVDRIIE